MKQTSSKEALLRHLPSHEWLYYYVQYQVSIFGTFDESSSTVLFPRLHGKHHRGRLFASTAARQPRITNSSTDKNNVVNSNTRPPNTGQATI
mmetsp:Transcript_9447/g.13814  ORF Transcript_9447/g.13814 Transcript_9447/m.13814 type:complete len:92 (+) Transcript_9447:596-871(+)